MTSCFRDSFEAALRSVVNYKLHGPSVVCKAAEWLARYSDMLLKKTSKCVTETEMDNKFNAVLKVICYIDDRDIYVRFYDKFLAVRLLQNIYASTELEKSMVTKLRGSYGVEFVKKSQQMLQDMPVSEGVNREFNEVAKDTKVSTKVNALKSGFWPLNQNQPDFQIPAEISSSVQSYHNFFTKKYDNRKLQWNYGASTNDVQFEHLEKTLHRHHDHISDGNFALLQ